MSPDHRLRSEQSPFPISDNGQSSFGSPHPRRREHAETDPGIVARLEWLDDLIFSAIEGDPTALENAAEAWQKSLEELGADVLEESRRQYLRCAQSVWHSMRNQPNHPPHKIFAAIEVISLLADKAW